MFLILDSSEVYEVPRGPMNPWIACAISLVYSFLFYEDHDFYYMFKEICNLQKSIKPAGPFLVWLDCSSSNPFSTLFVSLF